MNDLFPKLDNISIFICLDDILGATTFYGDASPNILFEQDRVDLVHERHFWISKGV